MDRKHLLTISLFVIFVALAGVAQRLGAGVGAVQARPASAVAACPQEPRGGGPGELFRIVDLGNSRIQRFSLDNDNDLEWADPGGSAGSGDGQLSNPLGIAFSPTTKTYVADTGNDRIQAFDWKMRYSFQFGSSGSGDGEFNSPSGLAFDRDANLYVADRGNHRIQVFNKKGDYLRQWGSAGSGNGEFDDPYALAANWENGDVYVVDRGNDRVQWFGMNGLYKGQWDSAGGTPFSDPTGIAVHPLNGDVYVVDKERDRVFQFGDDGAYIRQWGGSGSGDGEFDNPIGITVAPVHGIFVVDTGNNRIQQFDFDGDHRATFGVPGTDTGEFNAPVAIANKMKAVEMDQCYIHNFTLNGESRQITVFYTLDSGLPRHHTPDNPDRGGRNIYAREVAEMTERAWRTFSGYGLKDPRYKRNDVTLANGETGDDLNVWMFGETKPGRCCHLWGYQIKTSHVQSSVDAGSDSAFETIVHEVFHSIQNNYGSGEQPQFYWEGGAANSQDKIDAAVDDDAGSSYMAWVGSYLRSAHQKDLRDLAYSGALFWTYFQEQLTDGSMSEPAYGIEVTDILMRDILIDYRGLDGVARALRLMDDQSRSLEQFWVDFTIANYVKSLGDNARPEHLYVDDDPLTAGYREPGLEDTIQLNSTTPAETLSTDLSAYSAIYYLARPANASCPYVRFDLDSDKRVAMTVANQRGGALLDAVDTRIGDRLAITVRVAQGLGGPDDGIGLILSGLRETASVEVDLSCVTPTLEILQPTSDHPGFAGPHDNPGTLIVTLRVSDAGAGPVSGLAADQFTASIGGAPASVLGASYIDDLYVLVLDAPAQDASGVYDLAVTLDGSTSDNAVDAVRYTGDIRDNMLVLDRSGSMQDGVNGSKIAAAQQAAQLQVTDMDRNAWAGLVSFDDAVTLDFSLQNITADPARGDLRVAINALSADGRTNIVAAVDEALDEIERNGGGDHACYLTLLSDGKDNEATALEKANLLVRLQESDCQVYAIALGPEADKTLLQDIADASGGQLYVATTPPPSTNRPLVSHNGSGYLDSTWHHRLMGTFEDIALQQEGRERMRVAGAAEHDTYTETVRVDDSLSELTLAVQADHWYGTSKLTDPDGVLVDAGYPGLVSDYDGSYLYPHRLVRVLDPKPGEWTVVVETSLAGFYPGYLFTLSGQTPIGLEVVAHAPTGPIEAGEAVPIVAMLHDDEGLLAGATVQATIENSSDDRVWSLPLYDDGFHNDGAAGDGVYGNLFAGAVDAPCRTDTEVQSGQEFCDNAYQVYARATLGDIAREATTAFAVDEVVDGDGDGMADAWEEANGLDPNDGADGADDNDDDGIRNDVEHDLGTDPNNPDTDGGGDSDPSEFLFQTNPLDPADDRLPILHELSVNPAGGAVGLIFTPHPDVGEVNIYRREVGSPDWELVVADLLPGTGVYTDTTAVNGTGYVYRLWPRIQPGFFPVIGAPVTSVPVTPGVDTEAPEGAITINDGAPTTTSKAVMLGLSYGDDALEMRISNDPAFTDATWELVAPTRSWQLADAVQPGDVAFVYVEFRDQAGNIGRDFYQQASIRYELYAVSLPIVIR